MIDKQRILNELEADWRDWLDRMGGNYLGSFERLLRPAFNFAFYAGYQRGLSRASEVISGVDKTQEAGHAEW